MRGRVTAAIFDGPCVADGEFVVAQHVHDADTWVGDFKKVGTLAHDRADEQSAIGAAHDTQLLGACVFVGDQVFGGADEVVKYILLLQEHATLVPGFAVFAATTQVRYRIDAAIFKQYNVGGAERRQNVDVKSAVGIEQRRIVAVHFQALFVDDEHRHLGAVLAIVEDLIGLILRGIKIDFRLPVLFGFVGFDVVFEDRRGIGKGSKGVECRFIILFTLNIARSADAGQRHFAKGLAIDRINVDFAACILQVACKNFPADKRNTGHDFFLFRNNDRPVFLCRLIDVDFDQALLGGAFVGHHKQLVANVVNHIVTVVKCRDDVNEFGSWLGQIFDFQCIVIGGTFAQKQQKEAFILGSPSINTTFRMGWILINQLILALICAELVEIDLLIFVFRGKLFVGFGFGKSAVKKAIPLPGCALEFDPFQVIGDFFAFVHVHDKKFVPVRAAFRYAINGTLAISGNAKCRKGGRAVG